jgi:hypothetical protein
MVREPAFPKSLVCGWQQASHAPQLQYDLLQGSRSKSPHVREIGGRPMQEKPLCLCQPPFHNGFSHAVTEIRVTLALPRMSTWGLDSTPAHGFESLESHSGLAACMHRRCHVTIAASNQRPVVTCSCWSWPEVGEKVG